MTAPTAHTAGQAGLHVRYEKAGLILDTLPIPWNADAVIVEANVRLPAKAPRDRQDFTLRLPGDAPAVPAELVARSSGSAPLRVFFRFKPLAQAALAQVFWRERALGQVELPIIAAAEFIERFAFELPTLHAALGTRLAACRCCVSTQAKSIFVSGLARGPGPLAAALDLGLRVEIERNTGEHVGSVAVTLTSEQLRARQALVSVQIPRLRATSSYRLAWHLGPRLLHVHSLKLVSKRVFANSLRISSTRFIVYRLDGTFETLRTLPARDGRLCLDGLDRIVPCFLVSSSEPGMAGLAPFTVRAMIGEVLTTVGIEEDMLVTDGPTPVMLGILPVSELAKVRHFTLASGGRSLGNLPLLAAPAADFTAEGGFAALDDYLWSAAAEEQFKDRLGKLLEDA